MAKINRGYKKFLAVGCSHGHMADPKALAAVLKFSAEWKPDTRIHLGDFTDQAAFRSGAKGTSDETASIKDDLTAGLGFLDAYDPTIVLNGNHEDRLWNLAQHHNEILAHAASSVITDICNLLRKKKAKHITSYHINESWVTLGDTRFLHGFMYGEQAIRDHAEHFGRCVIAHLHRVGSAPARRSDHARAYCVGTLANIPAMDYAKNRRATAMWSHGFAWGEYNDKECVVWLAEANTNGPWRLPHGMHHTAK